MNSKNDDEGAFYSIVVTPLEKQFIEFIRGESHRTIAKDLATVRRLALYHHKTEVGITEKQIESMFMLEHMEQLLFKAKCCNNGFVESPQCTVLTG